MMDLMMYMPGAMDGPMGEWDAGLVPVYARASLALGSIFVPSGLVRGARVFSGGRGDTRPGATKDSMEEILRERFARGDISAEEYEKSMRTMRETPPQKGYEDYVRESEERLRSERDTDP